MTVAALFLQLTTCSMAAHAFVRGGFPGRFVLFRVPMGLLAIAPTVAQTTILFIMLRLRPAHKLDRILSR